MEWNEIYFTAVINLHQLKIKFLGWVHVRNTPDLHIDSSKFSVNIIRNICIYSRFRYWQHSSQNGVEVGMPSIGGTVEDLRGARGARPHHHPGGPNSLNFMQFLAKSYVGTPLEGWHPTSGKSWIRHWGIPNSNSADSTSNWTAQNLLYSYTLI